MAKVTRTLTAGILMLAAASGQAFSDFDAEQEVDIDSNAFNQVMFYDYTASGTSFSGVAFGDREVEFFTVPDRFIGAFLYDYSLARFTAGHYSLRENF